LEGVQIDDRRRLVARSEDIDILAGYVHLSQLNVMPLATKGICMQI
jgi:hypothetical protein